MHAFEAETAKLYTAVMKCEQFVAAWSRGTCLLYCNLNYNFSSLVRGLARLGSMSMTMSVVSHIAPLGSPDSGEVPGIEPCHVTSVGFAGILRPVLVAMAWVAKNSRVSCPMRFPL